MTLNEFLLSNEASLPKTRIVNDFAEYYKQITDEYFLLLRSVDRSGSISSKVLDEISVSVDIRDSILNSIIHYQNGHPSSAYEALKDMVLKHADLFQHFVSKPIDLGSHTFLYRLRTLESKSFDREDMFHIPFEKRHLVKTQRYSIPGFPSLYLSSSIYTAWKELSQPDLNRIVAVRLEPVSDVKFLNFPVPPQYFSQQRPDMNTYDKMNPSLNGLFNFQSTQIIAWPLLAACSVSVLEKDSPFKPEYIIPQIVLQLVRNDVFGSDIHGIRYFSLHFGKKYHSLTLGSNFVFPVKNSQPSGLCPVLKSLFNVTVPISWQLANIVTDEFDKTKTAPDGIELIPGIPVSNQTTQFARVEVNLIEQKASPL